MQQQSFFSLLFMIFTMFLAATLVFGTTMMFVGCTGDDDDDDNDDNNDDSADDPMDPNWQYTDPILGGTINCSDHICQAVGWFGADVTWHNVHTFILNGGVFIGNDDSNIQNTLTIEAGTEIHGLNTTPPGMLVITRNANINAVGTRENPIVFTSDSPVGQRARNDWGGVIINGRAQINTCGNPPCEAQGEGSSGLYGGSDDSDNSGVMKFVRIEFAGHDFSSDDELNGLALQGVGSGTVLENIQIHMNKDDGIEFFGGNAHVKFLVLTGEADDSLDWTYGWRGKAQHVVIQQYSDDSDNGIEADNNGDTDDNAQPRSKPMIANITLVGSPNSDSSDYGMLLREGTGANLYSGIVTGFNAGGLDIDDQSTYDNGYTDPGTYTTLSGELTLSDFVFFNAVDFSDNDDFYTETEFASDCHNDGRYGNVIMYDAQLIDPFNQASPNFFPVAAVYNHIDPNSIDSWFDSANYMGAFSPGGWDWMEGWTTHAQN